MPDSLISHGFSEIWQMASITKITVNELLVFVFLRPATDTDCAELPFKIPCWKRWGGEAAWAWRRARSVAGKIQVNLSARKEGAKEGTARPPRLSGVPASARSWPNRATTATRPVTRTRRSICPRGRSACTDSGGPLRSLLPRHGARLAWDKTGTGW